MRASKAYSESYVKLKFELKKLFSNAVMYICDIQKIDRNLKEVSVQHVKMAAEREKKKKLLIDVGHLNAVSKNRDYGNCN